VRREGNQPAQELIRKVFKVVPRKWRGIGEIPQSGLGLSDAYAAFDAEKKFGLADHHVEEPAECLSGLVLQGKSNRTNARPSARAARRSIRSARRWFRAKARARRITGIGGSQLKLFMPKHQQPTLNIELPTPNAGSVVRCSMFDVYSVQCIHNADSFAKLWNSISPACPIPISQYPHVLMAHGGGGKLMHQLIGKMFLAAFRNPLLETQHDSRGGRMDRQKTRVHDGFLRRAAAFFPGGDIGSMAVHGTVNDLAMSGARPLYLSSAFIIEEGLPMETLWRVVCSMRDAARRCGVQIITGDTKVVDKGKGDGLFINTAGIGVIEHEQKIAPQSVRPGDAVLVSGDLGRHGMAIMAVREGLEFESQIESDSAPVARSGFGTAARRN
jgi:hypothetical protein